MFESAGVLYLVGTIFLFILAVLWFFLPFAIFGIQPKVDKVLSEAKRTNELLSEIKASIAAARSHSPTGIIKCEQCGKEYSDGSATCPFCGFRRP